MRMENDQEVPSVSSPKKKTDKPECTETSPQKSDAKKTDKKSDTEDPKPRIVLTFRSEKPGAKSSTMKIVPTEEKHEEVPLRRSDRRRARLKNDYTTYGTLSQSPDKDSLVVSESDETSDNSHSSKRPSRRRSPEFENVMASAIARKEKSYNESPTTTRPPRRIKPTAKVLANEEMRLESQTSRQAGSEKSPEEGVRTRRSARSNQSSVHEDVIQIDNEDTADKEDKPAEGDNQNQVMKLKHLCELGLKARSPGSQDSSQADDKDSEALEAEEAEEADELDEDEEIDDDVEVISKLLEDDAESVSDTDSYYEKSEPRRSKRVSSYNYDSDFSLEGHSNSAPRRRSSRKRRRVPVQSYEDIVKSYMPQHKKTRPSVAETKEPIPEEIEDQEEISEAAGGSMGAEAACPGEADEGPVVATCYCRTAENVHAAPGDLKEPVFCQAIDVVDGVRVGCSLPARRGEAGACGALVRAGPRAPYLLVCNTHRQRLWNHMCCPACGLFCTQGIFYRCSEGHLFHLECGVGEPAAGSAGSAGSRGCAHCGVSARGWLPANTACRRVRLVTNTSTRPVYLPDQREHYTPAYLGFSTSDPPAPTGPLVPAGLLPPAPVDLKRLCERGGAEDPAEALQAVYDAVVAGETAQELIPKIVSVSELNASLAIPGGGSLAHAAARLGRLPALYLLHYAGADLDAIDHSARTPLMHAVTALCEKTEGKALKKGKGTDHAEDEKETVVIKEDDEEDVKTESTEGESEKYKPSEEELMKVIRYLIATGCDVNVQGPDGTTALHCAAAGGRAAAARELLAGGAVADARDHGGWAPLVWAAENDHDHVVRLLTDAGADAVGVDSEGNAAAHWCCVSGAARALQALLKAAPHAVHATNHHRDTPLHVAARQGHYACVIVLLARGARTDVENASGELPVEVCAGAAQSAISLNMQMRIATARPGRQRDRPPRVLSSDISRGRESIPIPCENAVDDTPLPIEFRYVAANVMPKQLNIDTTIQTMQGCSCLDGDCLSGGCACCVLGVRRWWRRGRLAPAFPYHDPPMLFQCNDTCQCNAKKCSNNVLSRLLKTGSVFVRTVVFRAGGARGWGLRASEPVPRGSPVAVYCGELLPMAEADARADDQYMFALDVKPDLLEQCSDKEVFCVDAALWGGAARFVNHSCAPSLAPVRVFAHARDLRTPTVALFAVRDIASGEELTFDYGDKFWAVKSKWMKCECGAAECRYSGDTDETS